MSPAIQPVHQKQPGDLLRCLPYAPVDRLERAGEQFIVAVEKDDPITLSRLNAGVAGRAYASVGLVAEKPDARISEREDGFRGAVGGAVVHDDDLEIGKRL